MHSQLLALGLAMSTLLNMLSAASLSSVCTPSYAQAALPLDVLQGLTLDSSSVTTTPVTNVSVSGSEMYPDATIDYCNVTFAYSHNGLNDQVLVTYWLPTPANFQNRYLSTGGGGLAINSGSMSVPGGIIYGAAAGLTDGGFGSFDTQFDAVFLLANGTVNWPSVFMFGYQAQREMAVIGKAFTRNFFNMTDGTKLYSYYQACSEGGREGWSQVQRYADAFDGAIIGAPAIRYGQQQVNHLTQNAIEQTLDYYPSPCEFEKFINETIAFCDPLDGLTDGVVARTDLCKLDFNLSSLIGQTYYCPATTSSGMGPPSKRKRQMGPGGSGGGASTPEQNGTITAQSVAVFQAILNGLRNSDNEQVYLPYQPSASIVDGTTTYNNATSSWGLDVSGLGGEWVTRFLQLRNTSTLSAAEFANFTYDTLYDYMYQGNQMYQDTLQTTWPDITPYQQAGGKILHYHGESDNSIPTSSSVRYYESVRSTMYPSLSYNDSISALNPWYRLYLVPGAAHCAPDSAQPNGWFPQTNMAVMIDWVEKGVEPVTLNATVLQGSYIGQNRQICSWPLRPMWAVDGTMSCVYDQEGIDEYIYDLNAWEIPVF